MEDAINNELTKEEILRCIETQKFTVKKKNKEIIKFMNIQLIYNIDEIPKLNELNPNLKTVIIFDNWIDEKNQNNIAKFYSKGRHKNLDVFY